MAKRLSCTYYSYAGIEWTCEIHQKDGTPASDEFTMYEDRGILLNSMGDPRNIFVRVKPTKATFTICVDSNPILQFIHDLVLSVDREFYIKLFKGEEFFYLGYIMSDGITLEDTYNAGLTLECIDGLGFLQGKAYTADEEFVYTGDDTILQHIFNALDKSEIFDEYDSGAVLTTSVEWFEQNHLGAPGIDPLDKSKVAHSTWYKSGVFGLQPWQGIVFSGEFYYADEVVFQCVQNFNSRILYSRGQYHIEQLSVRAQSTFDRNEYDKDGNPVSTESTNLDITIDDINYFKFDRVGNFSYLPPLNKVVVKYASGHQQNLIRHFRWDDEVGGDTIQDIVRFTINDSSIATFLAGQFTIGHLTTHPTPADFTPHRYKFLITIKVTEENGGGAEHWLKREAYELTNFTVNYDVPTWESEESFIELYSGIQYPLDPDLVSESIYFTSIANIISPKIPISEDILLEIQIQLEDVTDALGTPVVLDGSHETNWKSEFNTLRLINEKFNGRESEDDYELHQASNDTANSEVLEIVSRFGDAKDAINWKKLRINYTGDDYQDAEMWRVGASGPLKPFSSLLAMEMMALRKSHVRIMNGAFFWKADDKFIHLDSRLSYDGEFFLPLNVTIETGTDIIRGSWFGIARDISSIQTEYSGTLFGDENRVDLYPKEKGAEEDTGTGGGVIEPPDSKNLTSETILQGPQVNLPIEPAVQYIFEGAIIQITNQVTGNTIETVVLADVPLGGTEIIIDDIFEEDLPAGTPIQTDPGGTGGLDVYEDSDDFGYTTNNYIELTKLPLPDPGELSVNAIRRRVKVFRNGVKNQFMNTFTEPTESNFKEIGIDVSGENNRITFPNDLEITEFIEVYWH